MATADKLITVAENVPKVYHAGQLNVIENTSTLKKSASGSAILIDDVSPVTHNMGVKVRGKNLFDKDNYIVITGENSHLAFDISKLIIGKKYTFSSNLPITWFKISNEAVGYNSVQLSNLAGFTTLTFTMQRNSNISSTATQYLFIGIDTSANKVIRNISELDGYNIQIELGTTATAYTPYIPDLTAVKVTRCGKNLFDGNIQVGYALTGTGDNRTVTRSGTDGYKIIRVKPNTAYCFSGDFSASKDNVIRFATFTEYPTENSVSNKFSFTDKICVFTTTDNDNYLFIWIMVPQKTTDIAMQIEEGATATEYEQYNGQTVIANADGTVEGLTSLYPNTTLTTDTDGVIIDCEYYKDIDVNEVVTRTVTSYSNPKIKVIGNSAFYGYSALTAVNFPVATSIGDDAFGECESLTTINFPVATSIGNYAFEYCYALTAVNFPAVTSIGNCAFYECSALTAVNFPAVTSIGRRAFDNCASLTTADFTVATSIGNSAFNYCPALTALILRNSTICSLSSTNAFNLCTLITGTGGYIYVPSSLINAYKTATNWVTYASKFRALEDYTVDGTTTGALDESKVSA